MSALQQFIGCYFHEDFIEDYGSPKGAVDAYLKGFSIESVQQALAELRELLARNMSEDDLGHYVWVQPALCVSHACRWTDTVAVALDGCRTDGGLAQKAPQCVTLMGLAVYSDLIPRTVAFIRSPKT